MKNQYNLIKEKVEQGFFVLVLLGSTDLGVLFSSVINDEKILGSCSCSPSRNALLPAAIGQIVWHRSDINEMNLEIVEYFRPNDLFPSKRFEAGDRVEVKLTNWSTDPRREVLSVALTKDWVVESIDAHSGHLYYTLYSTSQGNTCYLSALHVYPKIEKQEENLLGHSVLVDEKMEPGTMKIVSASGEVEFYKKITKK